MLERAVAPGRLLLRIPRHLMIAEQRLHSELAPLIAACPDLAEDDSLLMAAYLLVAAQQSGVHPAPTEQQHQAATHESWAVYLKSLPVLDELLGLPYLWADAQIDSVGLPSWAADVKQSKEQVFGADFDTLKLAFKDAHKHAELFSCPFPVGPRLLGGAALGELRPPAPPEYAWARACVSSRSFLDGGFMDEDFMFAEAAHMLPTAMIPAADMLNHSCDGVTCTAQWRQGSAQAAHSTATAANGAQLDKRAEAKSLVDYVLRSPCDMPAGTEVLISYGEKGGEDMLESHGFVPRAPPTAPCGELNPYQSLYVPLLPAAKCEELADCPGLAPAAKRQSTLEYFTSLESPVEITGTMPSIMSALGLFRLALCPPSALQGGAHPDAILQEVSSAQHEAAVLLFLVEQIMQHCGAPYGEWSTTIQDTATAQGVSLPATSEHGHGASAGNDDKGGVHSPPPASVASDVLQHLPSAGDAAGVLVAELKRQRQAIAEHVLGFLLTLRTACCHLAAGASTGDALVNLKLWLLAAQQGVAEGGVGGGVAALALPMWHPGDVSALGEEYLGKLLAVPGQHGVADAVQ